MRRSLPHTPLLEEEQRGNEENPLAYGLLLVVARRRLVVIPLLSVFYTIFREFVYLHLKKKQIKQVTKTEIEEYTAEEMVNSDISEVK